MGKNKKGDFTVTWIITIALLVIGFIFLLVFFYNILDTRVIDNEVCHESVVLRATMPALAQNYLPLKCKTRKICITSGGIFNNGECSDLKGEKSILIIKVKSLKDIEKIYAQEILDCWTMMGEGKLSLFHNSVELTGLGQLPSSCVICARIAFDNESLIKNGINLSQIDVRAYMARYKVPSSDLTYFEYIAGQRGAYTIDSEAKEIDITELAKELGIKDSQNTISLTSGENLETKNLYSSDAILFMQVIAPEHGEVFTNTVVNGGLALAGLGYVAPKIVGGIAKTLWPLAVVFGGVQQFSVWANRGLSASYCTQVSINDKKNRDGCSVVRSTGYNLEDISQYCTKIESIP